MFIRGTAKKVLINLDMVTKIYVAAPGYIGDGKGTDQHDVICIIRDSAYEVLFRGSEEQCRKYMDELFRKIGIE